MLSEKEFDLLYRLSRVGVGKEKLSQRSLAKELDWSVGSVNQLLAALRQAGLIHPEEYALLPAGEAALAPYKVDNAIIMAAGLSSRFAPLSYEKPKGLWRVRGEVLIERQISQLQAAGIGDITLVVGYMKEKFFYLEEKYGVRIVVNDDYYRYNNTSTLIRVLDRLGNTYICSSDNYFTENVFQSHVYRAYYAAQYAQGETAEYCMDCDSRGRLKKVTIGGHDAWYMLGQVYFDRAFSRVFVPILEREYAREETRRMLWEDLYIRYIDKLDLYIKKFPDGVLQEFDSLDELRQFDPAYIDNADSAILRNICAALDCAIGDIVDIRPVKTGLTNTSFLFSVRGESYIYRHPGPGTSQYIDRAAEAVAMETARALELDWAFLEMDPKEGWKLSRCLPGARALNYREPKEVAAALSMLQTLHRSGRTSPHNADTWDRAMTFRARLSGTHKADFEGYAQLGELLERVHARVLDDPAQKVLCHCNCDASNFLVDDQGRLCLIDWEYAGNDDPAGDVGTFLCCADYDREEAQNVIQTYLGHAPSPRELAHYLAYAAMAGYTWFLWALYQESLGKSAGAALYTWYKNAGAYAAQALSAYDAL